MTVIGVSRFERFFRAAASLDVDKNDLKRYSDFVDGKLYDLLLVAQAAAKANDRDIVELWDLPITKGLQESIHRFRRWTRRSSSSRSSSSWPRTPRSTRTQRGDRGPVPGDHRRAEPGTRRNLQDHVPRRQKPPDQALGGRDRHLRPAPVAGPARIAQVTPPEARAIPAPARLGERRPRRCGYRSTADSDVGIRALRSSHCPVADMALEDL